MASVYKIYVRDQYLNKVAEIDDFQSLEIRPTFNLVGAWQLTMAANCQAAVEIVKPKAGIIVIRNGVTIFSGPANQRQRKWTMDNDVLTISGYDDMILLQNHLVYPTPLGPPFTDDYDVRTGSAETIMKAYVNANIGSNASSFRKMNLTTDADEGRGNSITGRGRFQTLLDLCGSIALQGGDLGFKVVQVGNALQFQVYQPTDKTQSVIFSPLIGNLLDFEYTETNPTANVVIAGGGGVGASRSIAASTDNNSVATYGRYELFLDKRDTTDQTELNNAITEQLANDANQYNLAITPIDTDAIQFGRDYNLGDKVSVVLTKQDEKISTETLYYYLSVYQTATQDVQKIEQIESVLTVIQDVVRQITINITPDGESITPSIGSADSLSRSIIGIFRQIKKINKRVTNLERV